MKLISVLTTIVLVGWLALTGIGGSVRSLRQERQTHGKPAALIQACAVRAHRAAVEIDDLTHQREPDAEPIIAAGRVHLLEHVENAFEPLRRNTDTGILDGDDRLGVSGCQPHRDEACMRSEFRGIREQIREHLGETVRITLYIERGRWHVQS